MTAIWCSTSKASIDPPVGLMFFTIAVPAVVPSVFQSSFPGLPTSGPTK